VVFLERDFSVSRRRLALAYGRVSIDGSQREVWVPISSTKLPGERDRCAADLGMRHRSLKNSSRSAAAPVDLFFDFVRDVS
jgi:hypothetical protein